MKSKNGNKTKIVLFDHIAIPFFINGTIIVQNTHEKPS